jgi:hypothetical protein
MTNDPSDVGKRDGGAAEVRDDALDVGLYMTFIKVLSVIWIGGLIVYFVCAPAAFLRMWPNEVGDLFAGWFAPLAMAWVGVAVLVQKQQLEAQRGELKQNSESLRLQAEELRRSVEQLEKHTAHMNRESARRDREQAVALLDRHYERVMFAIERIARTGEECKLRSPRPREDAIDVHGVLGGWRKYADWSRSDDVGRSVEVLGNGLTSLVELLRTGWVFDASFTVLRELCIELRSLDRTLAEVERTTGALDGVTVNLGHPDESSCKEFRRKVTEAYSELEAMEREIRRLDSSDRSA